LRKKPNRNDYKTFMRENVFGVPESLISSIGRRIELFELGLARNDQPIGAFLLTGDPGVGKTLTGNATAEFLHGTPNAVIHIAGEHFALQHEIAKLKGAPPGYLGHRETTPIITQAKLNSITSETSRISVVIVDELDKAHPQMSEHFLDALQKARWALGDNSIVNCERCLFFFTANFGSEKRRKSEKWGFVKKFDGAATSNDLAKGVHPAFLDRIEALGGIHDFPEMSDDVRERIIYKTLKESEEHLKERLKIRVALAFNEELYQICMRGTTGRNVAAKVKDSVDEMCIENADLLIKITGNEKDLSKNVQWIINPDFSVKQVVTRDKSFTAGEGV